MLAIRLQRTGRHGHAQFRVVVQDSHKSPKSGKVVAHLGSYNPHTKATTLDKEKAQKFLDNGAQPSDRAVGILKAEGVKLPKWVSVSAPRKRTTRNPEKLQKAEAAAPAAAPADEPAPEAPAESAEAPATEEKAPEAEAPKEEATAEEAKPEEAAEEKPAEEPAAEPEAEKADEPADKTE